MAIPFSGRVPSRNRRNRRSGRTPQVPTVDTGVGIDASLDFAVGGRAPTPRVNGATRRATLKVRGYRGWTPDAWALLGIALVLSAVGLVFVASSSSVYALHRWGSSWYLFSRQLRFVLLGLVALLVTIAIPYRLWSRLSMLVLGGALFLTGLTFTPLGISKNGAARWVGIGGIEVQPTEFLKFGLAAALAAGLARIEGHPDEHRKILNQLSLALIIVVGPVFLQPDMGTAVILVAIAAAMVVATGMSSLTLAKYGTVGVFVLGVLAVIAPYRRRRVLAFLDAENDPTGIGFHVLQSKRGFASGEVWGVGVGASRAKWGFLPNSYTDFIYAVIGEELGLVGALLILIAFLSIALIGVRIARSATDRFASLFAIGVTTWLVSQAAINMGTVIGTVPVTGVPLPFISMGGSSFVIIMVAVGALVNVARHGRSSTSRTSPPSTPSTSTPSASTPRASTSRSSSSSLAPHGHA